jgi:serine/threonine protein kinase
VLFAIGMRKFPVAPINKQGRVIDTKEYKLFCSNDEKYSFPADSNVSDEFKDLFNLMFKKNPSDRIFLKDILKHPWVTKYDLPTYDEIMEESLRVGKLKKGKINQLI